MNAKPRTTVAAIVEVQGQFLMVEEKARGMTVYNQPAGHLEANESLTAAVCREVLEETSLRFTPKFVVGLYQWRRHMRVAFGGRVEVEPVAHHRRDQDIVAVRWLDEARLKNLPARRLRSPMALADIADYRRGQNHPLSCLHYIGAPSTA